MLSLTIVLAAFFFLWLARTLLTRRDESPAPVVPRCAWRKTKTSALRQSRRHELSSPQYLGQVLAYLSRLYGIRLDGGERFFVMTGLSPYYHLCVDDFIPMPCPACEWSSRHHDLIDWRGEALVKLADRLKGESSAQLLPDSDPSNKLTRSSAVQ